MRDLALALIISRAVAPAPNWPPDRLGRRHPRRDLAVAGASTDEVYAAMDYLLEPPGCIEKSFAARYLAPEVNPSRMALYDLSSSPMTRNQPNIDTETALDGIYVIRSTVTSDELDTAGVVGAYKNLAGVEKDFRSLKAIDIDLRPCITTWNTASKPRSSASSPRPHPPPPQHPRRTHLHRRNPPTRTDPVAPATTSQAAHHKTATHTSTDLPPLHSYQGLLKHLATLTRNDLQYGTNGPVSPPWPNPPPSNAASSNSSARPSRPPSPNPNGATVDRTNLTPNDKPAAHSTSRRPGRSKFGLGERAPVNGRRMGWVLGGVATWPYTPWGSIRRPGTDGSAARRSESPRRVRRLHVDRNYATPSLLKPL